MGTTMLVFYITVLLIFQVDMNSPSRVSTVPNLWVPLGERVGWARGILVTRPSLTTRWRHYFLACCWQYVTIDMYSTVQASTEVITPVQVVNDKAISKVKKCSVSCFYMETTSCAIPHLCSIIHFNNSCSLAAIATMPTGRTAQSLTAGSGSKRWMKRESCEHLIPSWFSFLLSISHDPWIIPAGYFSQPWHLVWLSYIIQHSSCTLPFVACGKFPPIYPTFMQLYPNCHHYCALQGYHASVVNIYKLVLTLEHIIYTFDTYISWWSMLYCIVWTLNSHTSFVFVLFCQLQPIRLSCVFMMKNYDSHGFLLKGSCFLSLLAFFLLFLLRNVSSFPAFFSSLYFWASSSCFWVAWGRKEDKTGKRG